MQSRRQFLQAAAAVSFLAGGSVKRSLAMASTGGEQKPNVLLILTDDQGCDIKAVRLASVKDK